ncbi:MAG TPA: hypothetical protein VLL08_06900 [Kineosporiaceae bacterium]|nr:hypothetical protein [Kineosporiaceae bacterium]
MNEIDLKDLFATAVRHPEADRIDTDAVLRHGRRRHRIRTGARFGAVLAVLVVGGSVAFAARSDQTTVAVSDGSTLSVACSPTGITVSGDAVAATSAGVVISVSSTMPAGSYLNFDWPGGGGGDALPAPAAKVNWTLLAPPGPLNLSCTLNGDPKPAARHTVTVTDPDGVWRSTTLTDLGCANGALLDWAGPPGSGSSPQAAADDLLPRFTTIGRPFTVARARIGYPDASSQTWIASRSDGTPYLALDVGPSDSGFTASPNSFCSR